MALVIDDHLLVDLLADNTSDWLRGEMDRSAMYTTAAWYYRVASAARRGSGTGSLSGRLTRLDPAQRDEALARIDRLPDWIGLVGPRLLIPVMASLSKLVAARTCSLRKRSPSRWSPTARLSSRSVLRSSAKVPATWASTTER